jgi:hypothetical protein
MAGGVRVSARTGKLALSTSPVAKFTAKFNSSGLHTACCISKPKRSKQVVHITTGSKSKELTSKEGGIRFFCSDLIVVVYISTNWGRTIPDVNYPIVVDA